MSEGKGRTELQEEAEAEVERFKDQLGPFVAAARATRMPMVFTNAREPGHPNVFANDSFLSLAGYGRSEVLGQSFNFLMAQGSGQEAFARVDAAFRGEEACGSSARGQSRVDPCCCKRVPAPPAATRDPAPGRYAGEDGPATRADRG